MKQLIASFLLCSVISYADAQQTPSFSWLAGKWEIKTEKGRIIEEWQHINDSTWSSKSYFLTNSNDSIPQETAELKNQNGHWYYIPVVKNQNNGQPVAFKIIYAQKNEFISETPAHDFPLMHQQSFLSTGPYPHHSKPVLRRRHERPRRCFHTGHICKLQDFSAYSAPFFKNSLPCQIRQI